MDPICNENTWADPEVGGGGATGPPGKSHGYRFPKKFWYQPPSRESERKRK